MWYSPPRSGSLSKLVPMAVLLSAAGAATASAVTGPIVNLANARCRITSMRSNQPVVGWWFGKTFPDWRILGPRHVALRAQRRWQARVYTVELTCTDESGNGSTRGVEVIVPKSRSRHAKQK